MIKLGIRIRTHLGYLATKGVGARRGWNADILYVGDEEFPDNFSSEAGRSVAEAAMELVLIRK